MAVPLRILIAGDSEADALLLVETLRRGGFEPHFQRVGSEAALRQALEALRLKPAAERWDFAIADYHAPEIGALKVLALIRESGLTLPLIAVSEGVNIPGALECMKAGAYDFIRKDNLDRLFGVAAHFLTEAKLRRQHQHAEAALEEKDRYLAMILDTADEAVVSVDADQRIRYFNTGAEAAFGYAAEEVLGRPLNLLLPESARRLHTQQMQAFAASGEASRKKDVRREIQGLRKDGTVFDAEGSISRVDTPGGVLFTAILRDISSRKQAAARLHHLAYFDPLTGLPNRTLFMDRLEHAVIRRRDRQHKLAVLMLDLDRFKTINDSLGHDIGDQLLPEVALRLSACVRREDTVARLGGDEFAVLLEDVSGAQAVFVIADEILASVSQPFLIERQELFVTASIGFSLFPNCAGNAAALVQFADTALYRAKDRGRNCVEFYSEDISPAAKKKLSVENKLRRALERDEFRLYYQPQVSLTSGRMIGAEALLRWRHPELGRVGAADFVPVLEETGLIVPVGEWVFLTAFKQMKAWQDEGLHFRVSVNVSAKQFAQRDLHEKVDQALRQSRANPQYVGIEVTEGSIIHDAEKAVATLRGFKDMGVNLSIDDFGTGYSSLSYLKRMPIDTLKIDRSFIHDLTTNAASGSIVQSIIDMSHNMKMNVIAEGVETEAQAAHLMRRGCDGMQGFLFEKPLERDRIAQVFREGRSLEDLKPGLLKRSLLIVEDKKHAPGALRQALKREGCHLLSADRAQAAFQLMETHDVDVVILNGRAPDMDVIEFLCRARTLFPETVRIVLTSLTNFQFAADAVNQGGVYKFLAEPWEEGPLRAHIREAFKYAETLRAKRHPQQNAS